MQSYTPTPDFYNDYIAHHGILGMHWGKRNGPPYPLGSDKSTGHRLKTKGPVTKKKPKTPAGPNALTTKMSKQSKDDEYDFSTGKHENNERFRELDKAYEVAKSNIEREEELLNRKDKIEANKIVESTKIKTKNYGDYPYLVADYKLGKNSELHVSGSADRVTEDTFKDAAKSVITNQAKIKKLALEAIEASDYYEYWGKPIGLTKQEFLNKLDIKEAHIYGDDNIEISVYEKDEHNDWDLLGGHSIDMEFDVKKPKRPAYVSMNG